MKPKIDLISDNALLIHYPPSIDENINRRVHALAENIKSYSDSKPLEGVLDIVPTYHTIQIMFDAIKLDLDELEEAIKTMIELQNETKSVTKETIEIPVCYEPPYAMDTEDVCEYNRITVNELIERHTAPEYLIYMMGFTPGFPYLGGLGESIATPRKDSPRLKIPAGSVGIAGSQTGVYPVDSPGGWQIIGRTPLKLFDPDRDNPFLLSAGKYIKFVSISKSEFEKIEEGVNDTMEGQWDNFKS